MIVLAVVTTALPPREASYPAGSATTPSPPMPWPSNNAPERIHRIDQNLDRFNLERHGIKRSHQNRILTQNGKRPTGRRQSSRVAAHGSGCDRKFHPWLDVIHVQPCAGITNNSAGSHQIRSTTTCQTVFTFMLKLQNVIQIDAVVIESDTT